MGITQDIKKIVKPIIKPITKDILALVKQVTTLQDYFKCPLQIGSQFHKCLGNYLFDIIGWIIYLIVWVLWWFISWLLNIFVIAPLNIIIAVLYQVFTIIGAVEISSAIQYIDFFGYYPTFLKNDVIRIVNFVFPVFGRNNKCYCAKPLKIMFDPLFVKDNNNINTWGNSVIESFQTITTDESLETQYILTTIQASMLVVLIIGVWKTKQVKYVT